MEIKDNKLKILRIIALVMLIIGIITMIVALLSINDENAPRNIVVRAFIGSVLFIVGGFLGVYKHTAILILNKVFDYYPDKNLKDKLNLSSENIDKINMDYKELNTHKCPYCGNIQEYTDCLCNKCGKQIREIMRCPNCGKTLSKFESTCYNCGTKIEK